MALTKKQRAFIEAYLHCWNATAAARIADYKHPNVQGPTLVNLSAIAAEIQARLDERAMTANEVLTRLAEQARNEAAAYVEGDGTVALDRLIADGRAHLVKGTKYDRQGRLIVEFYDAQAALVHIGRHHKLFTDNVDHTSGGQPITITAVEVVRPAGDDGP